MKIQYAGNSSILSQDGKILKIKFRNRIENIMKFIEFKEKFNKTKEKPDQD